MRRLRVMPNDKQETPLRPSPVSESMTLAVPGRAADQRYGVRRMPSYHMRTESGAGGLRRATYRTIGRREGRGIEGMSMGGYGALHPGLKYPDRFGVISSVAPSILRNLSDEPIERTSDTFVGDQAKASGSWLAWRLLGISQS
jgi:S-formylglutathione hydrolase FrmB